MFHLTKRIGPGWYKGRQGYDFLPAAGIYFPFSLPVNPLVDPPYVLIAMNVNIK